MASKRSIDAGQAAVADIPAEFKQLARDFFLANKEANKQKGIAEKARESLYAKMSEAGLRNFRFSTTADGEKLQLVAEITKGRATSVVDVAKLRSLVKDDETLFKAVSIGKGAAEEHFGKSVVAQATSTAEGSENVSVKPAT